MKAFPILCVLGLAACSHDDKNAGRSAEQAKTAEKTDHAAKKGALAERRDPAADLEKQKRNLVRLEANIEGSREASNTMGRWAAEWDARAVRKLIAKDEQLVAKGGAK
ncbi:MAG: hypothetical protein ABI321_05005 [Polyangia bacterium]